MKCLRFFSINVNIAIILLVVIYSDLYAGDNGKMKFHQAIIQLNDKLMESSYDLNEMYKNLDPVITEALKAKDIWNSEDGITVLLVPRIKLSDGKTVRNPYWGYVLYKFLSSDRYKNEGIKLKQQTCTRLLLFLSSKKYEDFYGTIFRTLFVHFTDPESYNKESVALIERAILKTNNFSPKYLLLPPILNVQASEAIKQKLRKMADKCKTFSRNNLSSWIALVMLAKEGDKKSLEKLIAIVNEINDSREDLHKAAYMFPYLCFIQKPEIVNLMKEFLENENIIDQGNDVMMRYTGLSRIAAEVLYTMLEDYVQFSSFKFNQNERKKCLNWFSKNKTYKFKKIDLKSSDPIISRVRYIIFSI
jgi:hypothetical protein